MDAPVVWVIDHDQWPRALLVAELIERGYDALGFRRLGEALLALRCSEEPPRGVVIETSRARLSAAEVARLIGLGAPTLALVDSVSARSEIASAFPWSLLAARPVSLGQVADRLERLLSPTAFPPSSAGGSRAPSPFGGPDRSS